MNYDPKQVVIVVNGEYITGFAEESMIKAVRLTEKRSMAVGAQGEVDFQETADDRGEVTLSLKHTSPSNATLHALYKSGDEFAFSCTDLNSAGGDIGVLGCRCMVKTVPDFERGKEINEVEWVLLVANMETAFQL